MKKSQGNHLFAVESALAQRQAKTDRLILPRLLKDAAEDRRLDPDKLRRAHAVILRWADLETSGRLAEFNETQMQGDFLAQVFGEALEYALWHEGTEAWHCEQHHRIEGETPDAILGFFRQGEERKPLVIVELKGPDVHLDRDRSRGRTAVDQCWNYMVNCPPECRWGVVSNIVSFRLYERSSTKRRYEHFSLQSLRDFDTFKQFYVLFHRQGLIDQSFVGPPRAEYLLQRSSERQREVGEELYDSYSRGRADLIAELHHKRKYPLDQAVEMAQRLLDRVVFIAFCEDRGLLPEKIIARAHAVAGFDKVANPRWRSFKALFGFIDKGNQREGIPRYNGGLFEDHSVDYLDLPDEPWTNFFKSIGEYDFADEVNLDVLGHLFERSITELEKLKLTGLFGDREKAEQYAAMPQSAKRKQLGVYYTPPELTGRIVQYTVEELISERFAAAAVEFGISEDDARRGRTPDDPRYWHQCLNILRKLKIVDPACGSGAFLFQAYDVLEHRYHEVVRHLENAGEADTEKLAERIPGFILRENLYGVDLSKEAVEITQLALWIRSAAPGQLLEKLSQNIIQGNSLIHDPAVHPLGFDWREKFPEVFGDGGQNILPSPGTDRRLVGGRGAGGEGTPLPSPACGRGAGGEGGRSGHDPHPNPLPKGEGTGGQRPPGFDCVIGNPPWERMKLQEREFFSLPAPQIATATNAAKRRRMVEKLETENPELFARYKQALADAETALNYCRTSGHYPLTGHGDINTYAAFAELASQLVAPDGRVGLLVPSGIASDMTTKDFFASVAETNRLIRLYDFENRLKKFFPDVDNRFKFSILNFGGSAVEARRADFVFFAHQVEELEDRKRHISLSGQDIRLLNPNTRTCPIFRTRRDADLTKAIYRRVPILIDRTRKGPTGNPWGIQFKRMFDQTNDAELFREADALRAEGFRLRGNRWVKGKRVFLPLYEAKMLQAFDHRAADVVVDQSNWFRQGQTAETSLVNHQNPEYVVIPRWWVEAGAIAEQPNLPAYLAFKNVTSPTNRRTMIASMIPRTAVGNSAPLMFVEENISPRKYLALLANLNSFALDYIARVKIGNVNLNFFLIEQFPMFTPDAYDKRCPWDGRTTLETWISERVLKLTCTAEDMLPLADACGFTSGSFKAEYGGRLNKWDETQRAELMAELDAAFFHLYEIDRDDAEYILSTFKGIHDPLPLLPGGVSQAELILRKYDELSAGK
jgi:hypothetical protein